MPATIYLICITICQLVYVRSPAEVLPLVVLKVPFISEWPRSPSSPSTRLLSPRSRSSFSWALPTTFSISNGATRSFLSFPIGFQRPIPTMQLLLPPVASLSLLLTYAGSTTVVVPAIFGLRDHLGRTVDLGTNTLENNNNSTCRFSTHKQRTRR